MLGVPDEMMGEKVGAVIVLVPGTALDMVAVSDYLATHIGGFKIPQYVAVSTPPPPRSPGGRCSSASSARTLAGPPPPGVAAVPRPPAHGYLAVILSLPPAGYRVLMSGAARPPGGA